MTQPHHHVFNALQQAFVKGVKIEAILDHLVQEKVIQESTISRYKSKNGMKILISYLRNQSYDTFLKFVECIFRGQVDDPSKVQSVSVVDSIIKALEDFDERNATSYAKDVVEIQNKHLKQSEESKIEEEQLSEAMASGEATTKQKEADKEATPVSFSPSMDKLTLPQGLHYVGSPTHHTFTSVGDELFVSDYFFSLTVPPLAVPEHEQCSLVIGFCCYGPFSISERYLLASDFIVIVAEREFEKPVTVTMEHCLSLPEYRKCSEVAILRADHQRITEEGLYTFNFFTNPDISPVDPTLSFQVKDFCILCAVLEEGHRERSSSSSSAQSITHRVGQASIDDDNVSSAQSSFDAEESGLLRSYSIGSNPDQEVRMMSTDEQEGTNFSNSDNSPQKKMLTKMRPRSFERNFRKLKRSSQKRYSSACSSIEEKRRCYDVEYSALLCRPQHIDPEDYSYQFIVFICTSCGVAQKLCKESAEKTLGTEVEVSPIYIEFEKSLKFTLELSSVSRGWSVDTEKYPTISLTEVQFHKMDWRSLREKLKLKTCPPRILFSADGEPGLSSRKFACKVTIENATTVETQDVVYFNVKATLPKGNVTTPVQRQHALDSSGNFSIQGFPHQPLSFSGYPPPSFPGYQAAENIPPNCQPIASTPHQITHTTQQYHSLSEAEHSPALSRSSHHLPSSGHSSPMLQYNVCNIIRMDSSESDRDRTYSNSKPIEYYENQLGPERKNKEVTREVELNLHDHIHNWRRTARNGFGLSDTVVDQLKYDNDSFTECFHQAYRRWKKERMTPVTTWELLELLYRSREFDAIENCLLKP